MMDITDEIRYIEIERELQDMLVRDFLYKLNTLNAMHYIPEFMLLEREMSNLFDELLIRIRY
jgi:hypothetical protein